MLGDVVHDDVGQVLRVVQERAQVAQYPELDRSAEPVARALGGHRPAPRRLVQEERAGETALVRDLGELAVAVALVSSVRKFVGAARSLIVRVGRAR